MSKLDIRIAPDVVQAMLTHLRHDTTDLAAQDIHVPAAHFTSPERARAEIALMKTLPLAVAHVSELPEPGDFITREVLGTPLILSRQADGSVQAFLNMCSHRGGRVEGEDKGTRRVFTCRYHGWSFDAKGGGLRAVPFQSSFETIERESHGLERFKTELRHGFVFVDFSNNTARSVADYLGPEVDAQLEPWQLEQSVIVIDKTFTLGVNWKLLVDGAIDVLHSQFLHPGTVGELFETNIGVFRQYGRHGQLFTARKKLRTLLDGGQAADIGTRYMASNLVVYPNLSLIAAPEHIECWSVWPDPQDPGKATVNIRFYARKAVLTPEIEQRAQKSWAILHDAASKEDWPMEEWIQQNAALRPGRTFRYGRSEISAQHLHRQLALDLDA